MKRFLILITTVLVLVLPGSAFADTCDGMVPIQIVTSNSTPQAQYVAIAQALNGYSSHYSETRDTYELCFVMVGNEYADIKNNITLTVPEQNNKDIFIKGLKISRNADSVFSSPLLTITNNGTGKVILDGVELTNVGNGLALAGSGKIEVQGGKVIGDTTKTGICVDISADGTVVSGAEIAFCGEGVTVIASNTLLGAVDAAAYSADKNTIHDNEIGIHVISGNGNKFGYNSIFGNGIVENELTFDYGILIEDGANDGLARPEVVLDEEGMALKCTKNSAGEITDREIQFKVPSSGEIEIYKADKADPNQGESLFASCAVDNKGICKFKDIYLSEFVSNENCGFQNIYLTALFTGVSSTMYKSFIPNGRFSVPSPAPLDIPSPSGLRTSNESPPTDDDTADVDGASQMSGADGSGGVGAASSCKASLAAGSAAGGPLTALLVLFPFVPLLLSRRRP
jgi:hypothetical protein